MEVRLSALRAGRPLPPGKFLVLISVTDLVDPHGHSAAGSIRSLEKSSDLIGNRTCDYPACSILPQPITLPGATRVLDVGGLKARRYDFMLVELKLWILMPEKCSVRWLNS
jgi:hypothetical protein